MASNLVPVGESTPEKRKQFFTYSRTGLKIRGKPSYEEWRGAVQTLSEMEGAVQWWIGDALNYGEHAYGEKYAQAVNETQAATWMTYTWVARQVEMSIRIEILSWHHHRLVAKFEPDEQKYGLDLALKNNWSVHQLRIAIRQAKIGVVDWQGAGGDIWLYDVPAKELLERIPMQSVDLLLTDPLYLTEFGPSSQEDAERRCEEILRIHKEPELLNDYKFLEDTALRSTVGHEAHVRSWLGTALDCVKPTGRAYICVGSYSEEGPLSANDRETVGGVKV